MSDQVRRIAVFTAMFPPAYRGGGPIQTLDALVRTAPEGFETAVVTSNVDLGQDEPLDVSSDRWINHAGRTRVLYASRSIRARWKAMRQARRFRPDVIYVNSFFDSGFSIVPQLLARVGFFGRANVLIAVRGEFSPSALALKRRKKQFYLRAHALLGLRLGVTWHAASATEDQEIRHIIGRRSTVIVREDDTWLAPASFSPTSERQSGRLRAATLSRLVPIKRVDMLLRSLRSVGTPLSLDVYGPAEDLDYANHCREIARALPEQVAVAFHGAIEHQAVRGMLADHDVMFMPTASESFGHVVAEALSAACPVVCADTTPWTDWLRSGGGLIVEPDEIDNWSKVIDDFASLNSAQLLECRLRAAETFERWQERRTAIPHLFVMIDERVRAG